MPVFLVHFSYPLPIFHAAFHQFNSLKNMGIGSTVFILDAWLLTVVDGTWIVHLLSPDFSVSYFFYPSCFFLFVAHAFRRKMKSTDKNMKTLKRWQNTTTLWVGNKRWQKRSKKELSIFLIHWSFVLVVEKVACGIKCWLMWWEMFGS